MDWPIVPETASFEEAEGQNEKKEKGGLKAFLTNKFLSPKVSSKVCLPFCLSLNKELTHPNR